MRIKEEKEREKEQLLRIKEEKQEETKLKLEKEQERLKEKERKLKLAEEKKIKQVRTPKKRKLCEFEPETPPKTVVASSVDSRETSP